MLSVTPDYNRHPDKGQFYVELIELHEFDPKHTSRVGYWCDARHLVTLLDGLLRPFHEKIDTNTVDEIKGAIRDEPLRMGMHNKVGDGERVNGVADWWKCSHTGCFGGIYPEDHFKRR